MRNSFEYSVSHKNVLKTSIQRNLLDVKQSFFAIIFRYFQQSIKTQIKTIVRISIKN